MFSLVFGGNFPSIGPRGAYIWRGDLTEYFLRYQVILSSRYRFGGLIFGGAYFRNFTVLHKEISLKKSLKKRFDMNIQKKVTTYDSKEESRLACSIQAPRWMEPITDNLN